MLVDARHPRATCDDTTANRTNKEEWTNVTNSTGLSAHVPSSPWDSATHHIDILRCRTVPLHTEGDTSPAATVSRCSSTIFRPTGNVADKDHEKERERHRQRERDTTTVEHQPRGDKMVGDMVTDDVTRCPFLGHIICLHSTTQSREAGGLKSHLRRVESLSTGHSQRLQATCCVRCTSDRCCRILRLRTILTCVECDESRQLTCRTRIGSNQRAGCAGVSQTDPFQNHDGTDSNIECLTVINP